MSHFTPKPKREGGDWGWSNSKFTYKKMMPNLTLLRFFFSFINFHYIHDHLTTFPPRHSQYHNVSMILLLLLVNATIRNGVFAVILQNNM